MTRSLALFVVVVGGALAPACFGAPPEGGGPGDPLTDPECQLDTEREALRTESPMADPRGVCGLRAGTRLS